MLAPDMRDLEPSIISLLAEHRTMTAEEITEALGSDVESVNASLQQLKRNQWVINIGGHVAPGLRMCLK